MEFFLETSVFFKVFRFVYNLIVDADIRSLFVFLVTSQLFIITIYSLLTILNIGTALSPNILLQEFHDEQKLKLNLVEAVDRP